jgi:hypothetical protein
MSYYAAVMAQAVIGQGGITRSGRDADWRDWAAKQLDITPPIAKASMGYHPGTTNLPQLPDCAKCSSHFADLCALYPSVADFGERSRIEAQMRETVTGKSCAAATPLRAA